MLRILHGILENKSDRVRMGTSNVYKCRRRGRSQSSSSS